MQKNSFKELEALNQRRFGGKEDDIKINIDGSFKLIKFIGSMFDVFVPGFFRIVGGFTSDRNHESDGAPAPANPISTDDNSSYYPDTVD